MSDLLEAADAAQSLYFSDNEDDWTFAVYDLMLELRHAVEAEKKRRAKEDTTRITKPKDLEHG